MVTFGDMMALLLTLFVLLFTYAELDATKYKALQGSLKEAFGSSITDKLKGMIELEGLASSDKPVSVLIPLDLENPDSPDAPTVKVEIEDAPDVSVEAEAKARRADRAKTLESQLSDKIKEELQGSRIQVERQDNKVVIRFPSEIAFPPGHHEVTDEFAYVLQEMIPILKRTAGDMLVAGHTDNVPINGGRYGSNWGLSAARATSVVDVLLESGEISPDRVTVQGFGESRPLAANDTKENRAKNRRVEISILAD